MITTMIGENFSQDILSRMAGVAADGPYQTKLFRNKLMEILNLKDKKKDNHLSFPVTWDGAHNVNLGITDIKDSNTESGIHLNRFIRRCNVFNTALARGKGYAYLQATQDHFLTPVSFASQRFTSSSYNQWLKIEKSFPVYWKAWDACNEIRIEEEQYQYMIAGWDFVLDLLAFLDTMSPIVDMMLRLQSLDGPLWKLKTWWQNVKSKMESSSVLGIFPRIQKEEMNGKIASGKKYKDVTLLDGWLYTLTEDDGKEKVYVWDERGDEQVRADHIRFAKDLLASVDSELRRLCLVST